MQEGLWLSRVFINMWLNIMEFLAGMWHAVVKTVWKFNGNIIIFSQKCSTFYLSLLFVATFPH